MPKPNTLISEHLHAFPLFTGVIFRLQHLDWLRRVHILRPTLFRNSVINTIRPNPERDEFDYCSDLSLWDTRFRPEPEEAVVFEIYGHIDGVEIFNNSDSPSIKPILNKLAAVKNTSGTVRLQFPSEMPVFLTGIYRGAKEGFYNFTEQYSDELKAMKLKADTVRDFYCELVCMICDMPQRVECKGTTSWSGFNGCERCIQKGESLPGKMLFPKIDAPRRLDSEWDLYRTDPFHDDVCTGIKNLINNTLILNDRHLLYYNVRTPATHSVPIL